MFGRRSSRPEDAVASTGDVLAGIPAPVDHLEMMEERLRRLEDEELWQKSHAQLVVSYNRSSIAFWLLCVASLSFAALNGYHGFFSSGGVAIGFAAFVIGILYFTIELTVPVSAHLMSWGSKGESRWAVRGIGIIAYALGIGFSLLILQGKFSSGADSASAQSEARAAVFATDSEQLTANRDKAKALREKLSGRSADSFLAEMKAILATPAGKGNRSTLGEETDECQGSQRYKSRRDLCAKYNELRELREDALSLDRANAEIQRLSGNMMDTSRTSVRSADVQDKVIARVLGVDMESIRLFKSSFIAMMAALLTHLLWAAHGYTVNSAIVKKRDELFERSALKRAMDRAQQRQQKTAEQTTAEFMKAKGTHERVASAVASAPLKEQPVAIQIQRYFTERAVMGDQFSMQVGVFHDDYAIWCKANQLAPTTVDRFVNIVSQLDLGVSADGRIVGAALRAPMKKV